MFSKKLLTFAAAQFFILLGLIWFIAGNDRLFRSTVPIEQRLVSANESIRKKAQQELLGMDADAKRRLVPRLVRILENERPAARKWTAISLALIGPAAQDAIPALLQLVSAKEKDVAQASRVALSEIGAPDPQQLPSLLIALKDSLESVRCEAALSIGKMGPAGQDAFPALLSTLQNPADTPVCIEEAMTSLIGGVPELANGVLAELSSPSVVVRRKAGRILAKAPFKDDAAVERLVRALPLEKDPEVRGALMKALRMPETPDQTAEGLWAAVLRGSQRSAARLAALNLLRARNPPSAPLVTLWSTGLRDPDPAVRLALARWIRERTPRGPQSYGLVFQMLGDSESSIRRLGLETLRRAGVSGRETLQRVAKAQRDSDPGVRCRAAGILVEAGAVDRISTARLIEDLKKEEDTARCAEDVLGLTGLFDGEVVRSMIRILQTEEDPDFRSRAARVLMHLGARSRPAIPALVHAERDAVPGAAIALRAVRASIRRK